MANAVRVKVELRNDPVTRDERDREFRFLMARFRRAVSEAGVLQKLKETEFFESKSEKKRRKKKEAKIARLKSKLSENFVRKRNYEQ